ncbi:MAG: fatty acid desaturase [Planctomycetaceae bacterium]|nr:fatty acid desaturase [Planctomycetaceae bacterium]
MGLITNFTASEQRELDEKRTIPRLSSMPLALASMGLATIEPFASNPWLWGPLCLFTASMMFCWTSALHEAAHQTLWKSQWLSILTGRALGTFMFTPYTVYRESHIRHHAYLNTPRDWELWPYTDPDASLTFRRVFVWFDLLCGVVAGPIIYGRLYFSSKSPIKSPDVRRTIAWEYVGIVAVWAGIWGYTTWAGLWPLHARNVLLPMYLAATAQTVRKFTEHLGMASFDPLLGTRTVLPRKWLLRLSSFLNFDIFIHGPHHRHPRLVHTHLEAKLDEYRGANPEVSYPAYERYWQASLAMLPCLWRNPGCGVNAGALLDEKSAATAEAEDFASDVVGA